MSYVRGLMALVISLMLVMGTVGCRAGERTGRALDRAAEKTGQGLKKIGQGVQKAVE